MAREIYEERYEDLVRQLINARKELNFSQQWVASQMGWSQEIQARVEKCRRKLGVVEFADLARLLGLDPAALLDALPAR